MKSDINKHVAQLNFIFFTGFISCCLRWLHMPRNYKGYTEKDGIKPGIIFASQGLRFGSPFSPPLADLEYILRIRTLIFHWLRLPVHVSNQKTFYTEHMLSTKCKQKWHRNALI